MTLESPRNLGFAENVVSSNPLNETLSTIIKNTEQCEQIDLQDAGVYLLGKAKAVLANPTDPDCADMFVRYSYEDEHLVDRKFDQYATKLSRSTIQLILDANAQEYMDRHSLYFHGSKIPFYLDIKKVQTLYEYMQVLADNEKEDVTNLLTKIGLYGVLESLSCITLLQAAPNKDTFTTLSEEIKRDLVTISSHSQIPETMLKFAGEVIAQGAESEDKLSILIAIIQKYPGISRISLASALFQNDDLDEDQKLQAVSNLLIKAKTAGVEIKSIQNKQSRRAFYFIGENPPQSKVENIDPLGNISSTLDKDINVAESETKKTRLDVPLYLFDPNGYHRWDENRFRQEIGNDNLVRKIEILAKEILKSSGSEFYLDSYVIEQLVKNGFSGGKSGAKHDALALIGDTGRGMDSPLRQYLLRIGYFSFVDRNYTSRSQETNKYIEIKSFEPTSNMFIKVKDQLQILIGNARQIACSQAYKITMSDEEKDNNFLLALQANNSFKEVLSKFRQLYKAQTPFDRFKKRTALLEDIVLLENLDSDLLTATAILMDAIDRIQENGWYYPVPQNTLETLHYSDSFAKKLVSFNCELPNQKRFKDDLLALSTLALGFIEPTWKQKPIK